MLVPAVLALFAQLVSSHAGPSAPAATPAPAIPVTKGGGLTWAVPVTLVKAAGTYSSGTGMGAAPAAKSGFTLRGAIAEGPDGAVFFKLTGPRRSVAAAGKDFDALVASLKP